MSEIERSTAQGGFMSPMSEIERSTAQGNC
jgi:hypothetical protein